MFFEQTETNFVAIVNTQDKKLNAVGAKQNIITTTKLLIQTASKQLHKLNIIKNISSSLINHPLTSKVNIR
jgi:hypothetical protein